MEHVPLQNKVSYSEVEEGGHSLSSQGTTEEDGFHNQNVRLVP